MEKPRKGDQKMQVTSIELPEELYRKVKYRAVDEHSTFKAIVQQALEQYLRGTKKGGSK